LNLCAIVLAPMFYGGIFLNDYLVKIVDSPTFCNNALVACDFYVFVILSY